MFDIGLFELAMVGIVTLVVVGPEKLPVVAKKAGLLIGKTRHFISQVKSDIDQQVKAEELQKIINDHSKILDTDQIIELNDLSIQKQNPQMESDRNNASQFVSKDDAKQ